MIGNLLIVVILAFTGGFCIAWAVGMDALDEALVALRRAREDPWPGIDVEKLILPDDTPPPKFTYYRGDPETETMIERLRAYDEALKEAETRG